MSAEIKCVFMQRDEVDMTRPTDPAFFTTNVGVKKVFRGRQRAMTCLSGSGQSKRRISYNNEGFILLREINLLLRSAHQNSRVLCANRDINFIPQHLQRVFVSASTSKGAKQ